MLPTDGRAKVQHDRLRHDQAATQVKVRPHAGRVQAQATRAVRPWGGVFTVAAFAEWLGRRGTIDNDRASRSGHEASAGLQLMLAP